MMLPDVLLISLAVIEGTLTTNSLYNLHNCDNAEFAFLRLHNQTITEMSNTSNNILDTFNTLLHHLDWNMPS